LVLQSLSNRKKYKNIDIIHTHGAILHGTVSLLLSKKLKAKLIFTEHTGPFSSLVRNVLKKKMGEKCYAESRCCLCVSEHLKDEILENIFTQKTDRYIQSRRHKLIQNTGNNPKEKYKNILYTGD